MNPQDALSKTPFDHDAECSLLGTILLNNKAMEDIADIIQKSHFYDRRNQITYDTMLDLWGGSKPIDVVFLLDELKVKKGLTDRERRNIDKDFLLELISKSSLISSPAKAADIVKAKYFLRTLVEISDNIKSKSLEEKERVEEVLDYAQKMIYDVSEQNIEKSFSPISEVLQLVVERISEAGTNGMESVGAIPSGLVDLDELLGGFHKSDLVILAARPSMGKTSLALEITRRVAINESKPVAIFSLEMAKEQLVDKLLSSTAAIPLWKIRTGQLENSDGNDEYRKLGEAVGKLGEAPIWIDDSTGGLNITEVRTKARRLKSRHNISMIIIDYLQLMRGYSGINYGVNRVQEVSDISRALKLLAKELDIPILALSQLSRTVETREDKRPILSDLRESGSIEQDADVVMFVHREEMYNKETKNKGKANVIVAKHRNGETGTVELAWVGHLATFANLEGARIGHKIEK